MTNEEAIKILKIELEPVDPLFSEVQQALDMAIEALKANIVYCYECKYNGSCCQCVDIIDDLLVLNFCSSGERSEMRCE